MTVRLVTLSALVVLASTGAHAADADGWQTVSTGQVVIKARQHPGSQLREVLAEGELRAPAAAVARAVMNAERFSTFMPYTKESRFVTEPAEDGSRVTYTRVVVPFLTDRDFVLSARVVQPLAADGTGEFVSEWHAVNLLPKRHNVVRVTTNSGGWRVTWQGPGRCHIVYRFVVDPGGGLPQWLADVGHRSSVPDLLKAVEQEAQRLQAEWAATPSRRAPPQVAGRD